MMKIFINESIHNGILNYLRLLENQNIDRVHIFELWVIKTLVNIYGQESIMMPFELNKEEIFRENLLSFGLSSEKINEFIKLMDDYSNWLNSPYLVTKTDLPTQIESLLIEMIVLKGNKQIIKPEEIEIYYSFFDPVEGDLAKYKDLVIQDKTLTPELWRTQRKLLKDELIEEEEVKLLPASDYKRYGLDINEVKKLPALKINEINAKIEAESAAEADGQKEFDPKKLILSSGSGFVDTIVLFSIIATQILVALLIAFAFMRG